MKFINQDTPYLVGKEGWQEIIIPASYLIIIVITFLSLINKCYSQDIANEGWEFSKEENGIKIFTRQDTTSEILEIKAVTSVSASINDILCIITNVELHPIWMSNICASRILDNINENEKIVYHELDVPWPFENRDFVMHYKLNNNPSTNSVSILLSNHPDYIEERPCIVRIKDARGLLNINEMDDGIIEIEYQFYGDPDIFIPSWLINVLVVEGPYNTLNN